MSVRLPELAMVARELRVAARRRGTYTARVAAASLGVGLVLLHLLADSSGSAREGQALFALLSVLAFGLCLLAGVATTSDCVSEEKRKGTLGLLFLTRLRGHDIIIGKWVARSMVAVLALGALIPVMALPLLMGGLTGRAVAVMAAVLGNTLFLSLAVGMLVSVLTREGWLALGWTAVILGLLSLLPALPWLAAWVRTGSLAPNDRWLWVGWGSPLALFGGALEHGVTGRALPGLFWPGFCVQHGIAWACLWVASWSLPRVWREGGRLGGLATWMRFGRGFGGGRIGPGELEPIEWLMNRGLRAHLGLWTGIVVLAGGWGWGYREVGEEWLHPVVGLGMVVATGLWLKLCLAALACRRANAQARGGGLELVVCTPVGPDGLYRGFLAGLRQFIGIPVVGLLVGATWLSSRGLRAGDDDLALAGWMFGAACVVLVGDLFAVSMVGLREGLRRGRFVSAYVGTLVRVLLVPWGVYAVVVSLLAALGPRWEFRAPGAATMLWAGVMLGCALVLGLRARDATRRLLRDGRWQGAGAGAGARATVSVAVRGGSG